MKPPFAPIRLGVTLAAGDEFTLDDDAQRSLQFREINVKEAFTVVDASGAFFRASLKSQTGAVAYEKMRGSTESPARITLVCAVLGRQRMIPVVQKATELGCVRVVPVLSAHSVKPGDLEHEKPWAWPGQALKGARQSRRASVPEVLKTMPLAKAVEAPFWKSAQARFVLDDRAAQGEALPEGKELDLVLAVGPEGGWSDEERALLDGAGARPLVLGTRVLRAETAVFAGLAILQHRFGDLR